MRVLHFRTPYLNLSETFISRLLRYAAEAEPAVATVRPLHHTDGIRLYGPTSWADHAVNGVAWQMLRAPRVLHRALADFRPDVLHAHFGPEGFRAMRARADVPLVVSFYGFDVTRTPRSARWRDRYRRLAEAAAQSTTVSARMKDQLVEMGFPEDRVTVVRMGVEPERFEHRPRAAAGPRLLMVGRMVEKKGYPYALDAVARLRAEGRDVHLRLLGDGPQRKALEAQAARLGLGAAVVFEGAVANARVQEALHTHDVLLVPSVVAADNDQEGLPNTVIEGLATGIPVVASVHAGIPEAIAHGETGLLVPERDAPALAAAIARLLDEPALAAYISQHGRTTVDEAYTVEKMAQDMDAVYRRVLGRA